MLRFIEDENIRGDKFHLFVANAYCMRSDGILANDMILPTLVRAR
jgi:hypothetical protein